eukprot:TRINITY_DN186_c0_g1_i1.p1 TRINITY_DN186_c0_g1~~TRINITY_DN186_c0_g1_i1.p1  ORF type:complete len:273 (-),score=62.52 TRINITY_DN186_c0_g1_i1:153-971(-)
MSYPTAKRYTSTSEWDTHSYVEKIATEILESFRALPAPRKKLVFGAATPQERLQPPTKRPRLAEGSSRGTSKVEMKKLLEDAHRSKRKGDESRKEGGTQAFDLFLTLYLKACLTYLRVCQISERARLPDAFDIFEGTAKLSLYAVAKGREADRSWMKSIFHYIASVAYLRRVRILARKRKATTKELEISIYNNKDQFGEEQRALLAKVRRLSKNTEDDMAAGTLHWSRAIRSLPDGVKPYETENMMETSLQDFIRYCQESSAAARAIVEKFD